MNLVFFTCKKPQYHLPSPLSLPFNKIQLLLSKSKLPKANEKLSMAPPRCTERLLFAIPVIPKRADGWQVPHLLKYPSIKQLPGADMRKAQTDISCTRLVSLGRTRSTLSSQLLWSFITKLNHISFPRHLLPFSVFKRGSWDALPSSDIHSCQFKSSTSPSC